jgi:hypothetical protein
MANVNRPNGLTPVRHLTGGINRVNSYTIAGNYATKIHSGTPVARTGTDRNIQVAAVSGTVIGVFAGCVYQDVAGDVQFRPYWPAPGAVKTGTVVEAFVYDDPNTIFEVQATTLAAANVGQLAQLSGVGGSDATGRSSTELNAAALTTGPLKIIGIAKRADNDFGAYAKAEVIFNLHELNARTAV